MAECFFLFLPRKNGLRPSRLCFAVECRALDEDMHEGILINQL